MCHGRKFFDCTHPQFVVHFGADLAQLQIRISIEYVWVRSRGGWLCCSLIPVSIPLASSLWTTSPAECRCSHLLDSQNWLRTIEEPNWGQRTQQRHYGSRCYLARTLKDA